MKDLFERNVKHQFQIIQEILRKKVNIITKKYYIYGLTYTVLNFLNVEIHHLYEDQILRIRVKKS